jgi:hypothetical protein
MLRRTLYILVAVLVSAPVFADTIAIIGTGNVAKALGPEFAAQGHTIIYGSRNPDGLKAQDLVKISGDDASAVSQQDAVIDADIVVLAVPGMMVAEITKALGDLSGKIIIDPTNPLERTALKLEHGVETSNAEIIQELAPDAHVVKAFNTLNWKIMIDPELSGGPVSIPLAGDSSSAKNVVAELVEGMGLEAIDVGGVENAHWVEGMLMLWINNRISDREAFDIHLRKID